GASKALLIEADQFQLIGLAGEDFGGGQGGVYFGMLGQRLIGFAVVHGVSAELVRAHIVQTPVGVDHGLDEEGLGGTLRAPFFEVYSGLPVSQIQQHYAKDNYADASELRFRQRFLEYQPGPEQRPYIT